MKTFTVELFKEPNKTINQSQDRNKFTMKDKLTGSEAEIGRNSKFTGVGLLPGDETELEVGDSGN